ncbi:MAG TPA: plasmid pRiA4b ORF-3 family protein [Anaerolineaceae bacterium]|nr:plasmid pRiA4b ORF-3 family protein [Anaerolineaceae bacterium]HPN53506.1 plasmid pRiA4b ORF-3 family protein [Anaerolineaceae bacterium]
MIQIKITLEHIRPPIWRRILVSENTTLAGLHKIIQTVFGWYDCHRHDFNYQGDYFGDPDCDDTGELEFSDEKKMTLKKMRLAEGSRIHYQYDFGDSWDHLLLVEKILPLEESMQLPACLKGKRACPPEDVGGVWGYQNFLDAIADPEHEEHDEYLEWCGGDFDPEAFDLNAINKALHAKAGGGNTWEERLAEEPQPQNRGKATAPVELEITEEDEQIALDMELRRDMVSFLGYLNEKKVTGTQSTGNLPRKAIEGIAARFVHPIELESRFGDTVIRFQNEYDVPQIYFLHLMANDADLIDGGKAKRWRMTELGEKFLEMPPLMQVCFLFLGWWALTDWRMIYPWEVFDDVDYAAFISAAYGLLQTMPVNSPMLYDDFVRGCLQENKLLKNGATVNEDRMSLYKYAIKHMLVNTLENFGVLEPMQAFESNGIKQEATLSKTLFGEKMMNWLQSALEQIAEDEHQ